MRKSAGSRLIMGIALGMLPMLALACPHRDMQVNPPWSALDADTDGLFVPFNELPGPRPLPVVTDAEVSICNKLRALGCPEGRPAHGTCETSLQEARADGARLPDVCLMNSWDKPSLRSCGGFGYLTIACP